MDSEKDKRKRGTNFTEGEIGLLMQCIVLEMKTIENKKTDGATIKDKLNAWKRITDTFNSLTTTGNRRDINTLKMKYDNIKKQLKKKISENKENYSGTGGGCFVDIKLTWFEEKLYSLLHLGIDGLPSQGDSDNIEVIEINVDRNDIARDPVLSTEDNINDTYVFDIPYTEENPSLEINSESIYPRPGPSKSSTAENNDLEIYKYSEHHGDPKGAVHSVPCMETPKPMKSNKWNLKKRQRSTVTGQEKKINIESFQKLAETKINAVKKQEDCYDIELEYKKTQLMKFIEEWEYKKRLLELDVEIKKDEFENKKKLYKLQEEELNLKVDILKQDRNKRMRENMGLTKK